VTRLVAVVLACTLAGCGADAPAPAGASDADTVRMRVAWEVAPGRHPAADSLGLVSGVALDAAGNVYVIDRLAGKVWVFDAQGGLRAAFGRKGEGPGEFDSPTGPGIGPDGRLYVRDVYRVSIFGPDSSTGLLTRFEDSFEGPVYPDWMSTRATRFDESGAMLYPGKRWLEDGTTLRWVVRFVDGVTADTIFVPHYANAPQLTAYVRISPQSGRMLHGLNHVPFAPLPVWDVTPEGTVISGDAMSYELAETDRHGAVIARFSRDVPLDAIPADERRDSVAALRARLDSIPVALDRVVGVPEEVRSLDVPDRYPAYMAVYVSNDGDVWVRRWPVGGGDRSLFDVFARSGEFRHTVVLPRAIHVEPTPFLSAAAVVGVTTDVLTGESVVLRFEAETSR
jgi:hypothetical protein